MTRAAAIVMVLVSAGCPRSNPSEGSRQAPASVCTKAGQSCEYSPGKIGLCSAKTDECEGSSCLTCVSLH